MQIINNDFIRTLSPCYNPSSVLQDGKNHSVDEIMSCEGVSLEHCGWLFCRPEFMEEKEMSMFIAKLLQKNLPALQAENEEHISNFLVEYLKKRITASRQDINSFYDYATSYFYLQRGHACSFPNRSVMALDQIKIAEVGASEQKIAEIKADMKLALKA